MKACLRKLQPRRFRGDSEKRQERAEEQQVRGCDQLQRSRRCAVSDGNGAIPAHTERLARNCGETVNGLTKTVVEWSRPRMRGVVDFEQPRRVDAGIDLRRRQAGVAEKFLDGAQIAAPPQQMRREGMAQRMRRRCIRQVERRAHLFHLALDDRRVERTTARAAKQQTLRVEMVGAEPSVFRDRLLRQWQHRRQPRLAALSGDAQDAGARQFIGP